MTTDIVIPNVGESVTSGVIASWLKNDGDYVQRDETVLELETDKITMEVPAPASGVLKRTAKEGDEVAIGAVVGVIDESAPAPRETPAQTRADQSPNGRAEPHAAPAEKPEPATAALPASFAPKGLDDADARATPLARKVAAELGVDLANIRGTGAGNRIREQDVITFHESRKAHAPAAASDPAEARPRTGISRQRMSRLRQRIAERLVEAQHTAAMLTTFNECDMTAVMDLRKRYKESFEKKHGVGLGFMSFFVRAAVGALRSFPMVNAYIVEDDGELAIETHEDCDISIAVASPKGLVVPVIRRAQNLSFAQIELAVKDLGTRARDGKLTFEEMQGGTFTITNGGIFGSLLSTPILNPPQSAILGMHAIRNRAVEHPDRPGEIAIRPMMYLALSYDHRIIDGAEAVRFLVAIKDAIERPERLLLDV